MIIWDLEDHSKGPKDHLGSQGITNDLLSLLVTHHYI